MRGHTCCQLFVLSNGSGYRFYIVQACQGDSLLWRKKYNLTQKELSSLLSWGAATLSRYEQGDLQDDAHEKKMLRLVMDSHNLRNLVQYNQQTLSDEKRETLLKELALEL